MFHFTIQKMAIVLACGLPWLAGCEPNQIPAAADVALNSSEELELLSLEPTPESASEGHETFHDWQVLGKTKVSGESKAQLIAAMRNGMPRYDDGSRASCFWPRHGIRVVHDGHTYDFLICFQCHFVTVYMDDTALSGFQIQPSPQAAFDKELVRASVELAKKSGG